MQKASAWCNLKLLEFPQKHLPGPDFWLQISLEILKYEINEIKYISLRT